MVGPEQRGALGKRPLGGGCCDQPGADVALGLLAQRGAGVLGALPAGRRLARQGLGQAGQLVAALGVSRADLGQQPAAWVGGQRRQIGLTQAETVRSDGGLVGKAGLHGEDSAGRAFYNAEG